MAISLEVAGLLVPGKRRRDIAFSDGGWFRWPATDRFIGTPDAVIKVMLEAALKLVPAVGPPAAASDQMSPPAAALPASVVTTTKLKRRR